MTGSALCDQFSKHQENISKATLVGRQLNGAPDFIALLGFHPKQVYHLSQQCNSALAGQMPIVHLYSISTDPVGQY